MASKSTKFEGGDTVVAKEFLQQVEKLDILIAHKLIEKQQWRDIAGSITAVMESERVQSSGKKSKMQDAIDKCIDMAYEIDHVIDQYVEKKKEVIRVIEQVQNPTWYKVLHMKYIQHLDLSEIADRCNGSYDWAKSAHSKAMKIVQKLLDEK